MQHPIDSISLTMIARRHIHRTMGHWLGHMAKTPALWITRVRQRRQLAAFTDRDLRDIGRSHCDISAEIRKPFWRA